MTRVDVRTLSLAYVFLGCSGLVYSAANLWFLHNNPASVEYMELIHTIMLVFTLVNLPVAVLSIVMGFNLGRLLLERPRLPLRFAWGTLFLAFLQVNLLGLALDIYLIKQLERLAREAEVQLEGRVLN